MTIGGIDLETLRACTAERWQPGIGDPTLQGWLTVAVYIAATLLGLLALRTRRRHGERIFWASIVLIMAFLAVNKQLDLQSAATAMVRCLSQLQGWYAERRGFQVHAIEGLAIAALAVAVGMMLVLRRSALRNMAALIGLGLTLAFVMIRAVGFHRVDTLIGLDVHNVRLNTILELTGPILVSLNAAAHLRRGRSP